MRKTKDTLLNAASENKTRSNHKYKVGDYTYINKGKLSRKLKAPNEGPYKINKTNQATKDTVQVQRCPIEETIIIRRLIQY